MTFFIDSHASSAPVSCAAACGWHGTIADLAPIATASERISAGEIVPPGECPECGSLAHLVTPAPGSAQHRAEIFDQLLELVREISVPGGIGPHEFSRPGGYRARCIAAIARAEGATAHLIVPGHRHSNGTA